jgi:hypothetical protein
MIHQRCIYWYWRNPPPPTPLGGRECRQTSLEGGEKVLTGGRDKRGKCELKRRKDEKGEIEVKSKNGQK